MKLLPFSQSVSGSIGTELELQLIDPMTYDLIAKSKELIRSISESEFKKQIKPEVTQSMIEINSSIHTHPDQLYQELQKIKALLLEHGKKIGALFSGGGTHPFQKWALRKIFPSNRFRNKSHLYRYLSKQSTVFGQHIHIGCKNGEDTIYLTHVLTRYLPQLVALSASSPFYQEVDSGYFSCRPNLFNAFPTSGMMPYIINWKEFSQYFYKMKKLKIINTMKDFYWDIRPKPEFGTVEIRVGDTPLTLKKAVMNIAYIQAIANYLITERPIDPTRNLYDLYNHNKFQSCRFGCDGEFINPYTLKKGFIGDDILETIETIMPYSEKLKTTHYIEDIKNTVLNKAFDPIILRNIFKEVKSLKELVHQQCIIWSTNEIKDQT